jgi:hypothetical protein
MEKLPRPDFTYYLGVAYNGSGETCKDVLKELLIKLLDLDLIANLPRSLKEEDV